MFKDSFNCLNDVHKRCILNSIEFCTHLEILKKNFQGCLSVQLSKFIALKSSIYLCLRSFCVAVVSRRLDYNITTHHICQQLFSIFFNFFEIFVDLAKLILCKAAYLLALQHFNIFLDFGDFFIFYLNLICFSYIYGLKYPFLFCNKLKSFPIYNAFKHYSCPCHSCFWLIISIFLIYNEPATMQKIVIAAIIITPNNMLYPSGLYIPFLKAIQYMDIMNGLSENAPIIRYDITITYPMTGDIISPTVIWIMQKVIVISRLIAIRLIDRKSVV